MAPGRLLETSRRSGTTCALIHLGTSGRIADLEPAAERMLGYGREELRGKPLSCIASAPDVDLGAILERTLGFEARRKDGSVFPAEVTLVRGRRERATALTAILRDVSRDRAAETAARKANATVRGLVERVHAIVYCTPLGVAEAGVPAASSSGSLSMSARVRRLLGRNPGPWLADKAPWGEMLHPSDRERVLAQVSRTRDAGTPFRSEYRLLGREGRILWFQDRAEVQPEPVPSLAGIAVEISEIKRAEVAARETDDRYRQLVESLGDCAFIALGPQGYVVE
jgi:PAS domain S-box-containing protein